MNEIVPIGGVPERARPAPAPGRTIAINRFDDLSAGTYWRAKDEVPALTKAQRRERGVYLPEGHPDRIEPKGGWGEGERNRIGTEEYMVDVPVRSGVPEGRMLLLQSLKLVDGDIHAVVLKGHPSEDKTVMRTFLVDEFLHFFELVDETEAKAIRDAEVAAIHAEIEGLRQALIDGPPPEPVAGAIGYTASLPAAAAAADALLTDRLPAKPSAIAMIGNIDRIQTLQDAAERAVALAERQSKWITERSGEIAGRTQAMVPFFQERAAAALATTEAVMRYATELQKGVASLGLYTGEGVEVLTIADGKGADPDEPLVVYRDRLYMDEEYLAHLESPGFKGGADHEDFDDFVTALTLDDQLMARVFPYPRMLVLMRYRRSAKEYFANTSMAAAMANAAYNKPNMVNFLLLRNGDKLYQINADFLGEIAALYPTAGMGDQAFRGIDGTMLKPDDLGFSTGKDRYDSLARVYRNLAILLWGLHDRAAVDFGPFYDPADWTAAGFLDPAFQGRYMRFWDPYRDTTMVGTGRPPFRKWVKDINGWLRSGSRVLVTRSSLLNRDGMNGSVPDMRQDGALRTVGNGDDVAYEMIVRKTKRGHVVAVEASRMVYPRERYRRAYELKQTFDIVLDETDSGYSQRDTLRWLCLDMVEADDIDHFLQSRADRPSYLQHHHMLRAARAQAIDEGNELASLKQTLMASFINGHLVAPEDSTPDLVVRHAIRLWRAANRGAMPPVEGDATRPAAIKAMLNAMNVFCGNDRPIEAAEALAAAEGRIPLRLVMTGRDRWALYATSVGDEVENTLFEHVWVTRLTCQRKGGGLMTTTRSVMPMPVAVADEEILHTWDEAATWVGRNVPKRINEIRSSYEDKKRLYDYASIRKGLAKARTGDLEPFRTPAPDLAAHLAMLNKVREKKTTGRSVTNLKHVAPFAIVRITGFDRRLIEGFTSRYETIPKDDDYKVLVLQDCPFRMAYRLTKDESERQRIADAYASQYNQKAVNRTDFVNSAGRPPRIEAMRLADWAVQPDDPLLRESAWNGVELNANWAESVRQFDTKRINWDHDGSTWSPTLPEMLVWMDQAAPAILNDLCARFGWEAVPFDPKVR